jgi:protein SCO1/2
MIGARGILSIVCAILIGLVASPTHAETEVPKELRGIEIQDKAGTVVPRDLELIDQDGKRIWLADELDGSRPVVLVMAYFDCPMLCSLVINELLAQMKKLEWSAGKEYRALVVSFDGRDTPEKAKAKHDNYVDAYARPVGARGFDFLTGDPAAVKRLADAVGFHYRWDEDSKQFAHAAGAFVLTPDGRVSRTLMGLGFSDLRLALLDAGEGKLGTVIDRVVLFCFHYDPLARGYVIATTRIMKACGVLTVALLAFFLYRLFRGDGPSARSPKEGEARV